MVINENSEFSSPFTLLPCTQYYSLPNPLIQYIFSNSSTFICSKLFRSCKKLNESISKFGRQVDVLEIGISKRIKHFSNEKQIRVQVTNTSYSCVTNLIIKKRLLLLNTILHEKTRIFLNHINFSMVKEVFLFNACIYLNDYKKLLMVSSIEALYMSDVEPMKGFDMIGYTLEKLPNLKRFRLPWKSQCTSFATLAKIQRSKSLKKIEIYNLPSDADVENFAPFVSAQMNSENSVLNLDFDFNFNFIVQNKYLKIADDFNDSSNIKIFIRSKRGE